MPTKYCASILGCFYARLTEIDSLSCYHVIVYNVLREHLGKICFLMVNRSRVHLTLSEG